MTPVYWKSGKIDRVCRSPAAAETIAALDGEDDLLFLRIMWSELCGNRLDPGNQNECAAKIKGHLITDAKNLYDKLSSPIMVVKGCEKRSSIEALGLRENLQRSQATISWVNGDAMVANSLTKTTEKHQMMLFVQLGFRWKVVYDAQMQSAKVRRRQGIEALSSEAAAAATDLPLSLHVNNTFQSYELHQPPTAVC